MTTIHLALVDDWELSGNGSGDIRQLQFEPLRRLVTIYIRLGMLQRGKAYLESLLKDIDPNYRCVSFRSGAWFRTTLFRYVEAIQGVVEQLLKN